MKMEKPVIVLDDRAKDVGLAVMLSDLIGQNLEQHRKLKRVLQQRYNGLC